MAFYTVKWQWLLILHIVPLFMIMSRSSGTSSDGMIYLPLLLNIEVMHIDFCHLAFLTTLILHSVKYRVKALIGYDPMTNLNHHDAFS